MSMTPILTAARAAYTAGISVIPVLEDGSKAPAVSWTAYQSGQADAEQMRDWDFGRRTGLGVVTGYGDLTMFEFDDGALIGRFIELAEVAGLGELVERIRAGFEEDTPGEGVHWFYRCEDTLGNTTLARRPQPGGKRKALIQTRGRGGYAIVSPSHGKVHPSGKPYRLRRGGFSTIATITPEEQDVLWGLAQTLDECLRPEQSDPTPRPVSPEQGERPGDLFNAVATWEDILAPRGWVLVFSRGGVGYWRRPGKKEGISATTNHGGYDYFYPFTSSTEFDPERGYTRFSVYAHLEHGGDFKSAARELKAQGYGAQGPRFTTATLGGERVNVSTPEAAVDDKDRAIAELRQMVIEARRSEQRTREEWSATLQFLGKEEIGAADRITYVKLAATFAHHRSVGEVDDEGYALIRLGETRRANAKRLVKERGEEAEAEAQAWGLAGRSGLDRKTVSRLVDRFGPATEENPEGWGLIGLKRETGGKTASGRPISDVKVRMVAHRFADILVEHSDFEPEKPRNHGGKREPCPRCGSTATRTVTYCGGCDLILKETTHDGTPELTPAFVADEDGNIPPTPVAVPVPSATYPPGRPVYVLEQEPEEGDDWDPSECNAGLCRRRIDPALRKRFCWEHEHLGLTPDPPPMRPPAVAAPALAPLDPAIMADEARRHDATAIAARLSRLLGRWEGGEHTETLRRTIADWRDIAVARAALDAGGA